MSSKVSAIITTHNRVNDVVKAIESVKRQSYKDLDIIVVDDASEDETQSVCEDISGIKYIRVEKEDSKGGNHARNIGVLHSHSEYIAFLDDDDQWLPDKVEKQVQMFEENPTLSFVYCDMHVLTGRKFLNYNVHFNVEGDVIAQHLYWKPICTTSAMMTKKNLLLSFGGFDEKVKYWQEYELTLQLIKRGNVGLVHEPLIYYYRNLNDRKRLTNNYDNWLASVDYILDKHRDLFSVLTEEEKKLQKENFYR